MLLKWLPGSSTPLASAEYVFFLECLQGGLCYCISFLLVMLIMTFTLKQLFWNLIWIAWYWQFCVFKGYIRGSTYLLLKHFGEVALWFLLFFFSLNSKRWPPMLITRNMMCYSEFFRSWSHMDICWNCSFRTWTLASVQFLQNECLWFNSRFIVCCIYICRWMRFLFHFYLYPSKKEGNCRVLKPNAHLSVICRVFFTQCKCRSAEVTVCLPTIWISH